MQKKKKDDWEAKALSSNLLLSLIFYHRWEEFLHGGMAFSRGFYVGVHLEKLVPKLYCDVEKRSITANI